MITNTKKFTCESFFLCMNFSFVIGMSQLNTTTIGIILSNIFIVLGVFFLLLHFIQRGAIPLSWFAGTILLFVIGVMAYIKSGSPTLLKLIMFFYAVQKVNREIVMKSFIISLLIPETIVAVTSLLGITENQYIGGKMALSFGMTNPNTVPVIIFAIIIAYNLQHVEDLSYKAVFLEGVVTWLTYYFCRARTAGLVLLSYLVLLLFVKRFGETKFIRGIFWPLQYFFPVCAGATLVLTLAFRSRSYFWLTVNNIFSGRLLAWSRYLEKYGVSIFGNEIEMTMGSLDNAYIQLWIRYGLISFFAYMIMFIIISKYAYKNHLMVLYVSIIAYELYCIAEFGPLLINFCAVLIFLACVGVNSQDLVLNSMEDEVTKYIC